jgi:recombination protein RecR
MVNPCSFCQNSKRDEKTILVVEDISDLWTFERIGFFRGVYHVLGGSLSAMNGIGTDELTINKLIKRVKTQNVNEVILALSTTMEGQTTSHVVADKLEQFKDLTVTRLAQGVPIGGEVHFLDENTLNTAFVSRKKII